MRPLFWMFASGALHASILGLLLTHSPLWAANAAVQAPVAWMDVEPQAPSVPEEPAPPAPLPAQAPQPARVPASRAVRQPRPVVQPEMPQVAVSPDSEGGLAIGSEAGAARTGESSASASSAGAAREGAPEVQETKRVPRGGMELSLWMDRRGFEQLALVRPGLAIITAVPGLRDLLRGSNIRPFLDLERLRVTLGEPSARELAFAGVHVGGEPALRDAAKRVAAMRQQEPVWRGDSTLRATSWVDGSGVDRGLALNEGAFLIGARESLPALLGATPSAERVAELSQLRRRVVFALALEDAARYLPVLSSCALQALRVSAAATGVDGQRLSVRAEYESSSAAAASAACLRALGERAATLPRLVAWLSQASAEPGNYTTRLDVGVTLDALHSFLDEVAWALRSAARA